MVRDTSIQLSLIECTQHVKAPYFGILFSEAQHYLWTYLCAHYPHLEKLYKDLCDYEKLCFVCSRALPVHEMLTCDS